MKVSELKVEPKEVITDVEYLSNDDACEIINHKSEASLLQEIILTLKATMRANNYTYLTAPQVGYKKRVFCIKFGKADYRTFVNPMIENMSNPCLVPEACYSIPGKTFLMPRFSKVTLWSMTPLGKSEQRTFVGMAATMVEHCMYHLDGGLISDIGLELDDDWYQATDEEREEVSKLYLESLDMRNKQMQEELEENAELKQINDASKFIESVRTGETTVEPLENTDIENEVTQNE